jgi:hypothetical protein
MAHVQCTANFVAAHPGIPVPPVRVDPSADAMTKACRYSNCGVAQRDIAPSCSRYFGISAGEVQEALTAAGQAGRSESSEATAGEGEPPCTANLHCSRTVSAARGDTDYCGVCGAACHHTFPGKGLFLAMPRPEVHLYYDLIFKNLLLARPDVQRIYLDLGCRYKSRFARMVQRLVDEGVLALAAKDVRILLPWMHGCDHELMCQLANSGLYQVRSDGLQSCPCCIRAGRALAGT